jgi:hypothetical protein
MNLFSFLFKKKIHHWENIGSAIYISKTNTNIISNGNEYLIKGCRIVIGRNHYNVYTKELIQKEISKEQYDLFLVNNNVFVKGVQKYFNIQNRGYKYVCYMNKEQLKIFNIC